MGLLLGVVGRFSAHCPHPPGPAPPPPCLLPPHPTALAAAPPPASAHARRAQPLAAPVPAGPGCSVRSARTTACAHRFEYAYAFGDHFAADAVAGDDGDEVLAHAPSI